MSDETVLSRLERCLRCISIQANRAQPTVLTVFRHSRIVRSLRRPRGKGYRSGRSDNLGATERVVRQVTLVIRSIDSEAGSHTCGSSLGEIVPKPSIENASEDGPIQLESVVSDDRARSIVDAMLVNSDVQRAPLERTLEAVVQRELESAEMHGKLFDSLMSTVERILIERVYKSCQGVQTEAARHLGINRNTLHTKLCKYKLLLATQQIESIEPNPEEIP